MPPLPEGANYPSVPAFSPRMDIAQNARQTRYSFNKEIATNAPEKAYGY
jgi:hypothetical protein